MLELSIRHPPEDCDVTHSVSRIAAGVLDLRQKPCGRRKNSGVFEEKPVCC
jgi:hypothetical protein